MNVLAAAIVLVSVSQADTADYTEAEIQAFDEGLSSFSQHNVQERYAALREKHGKRPLQYLFEVAEDGTGPMNRRSQALYWAANVGGEDARDWLIARIKQPLPQEMTLEDHFVFGSVISSLGSVPDDSVLEFLKDMMHEEYWRKRNEFRVLDSREWGHAPTIERARKRLCEVAFMAFGYSGTQKALRDLESGEGLPESCLNSVGRETYLRVLRKKFAEGDERPMAVLMREDYEERTGHDWVAPVE